MGKQLKNFLIKLIAIIIGVIGGVAFTEFLKWRQNRKLYRKLEKEKYEKTLEAIKDKIKHAQIILCERGDLACGKCFYCEELNKVLACFCEEVQE